MTDEMTFYQFVLYAAMKQGDNQGMQQVGIGVGPGPVAPAELVDLVHQQLVQQQGLGTPRPTHYTSTEILKLPVMEGAKQPSLILPTNGKAR